MRTNDLHTKPQLVSGRAEVFAPRPPPHKALGFFVVVLPTIPCGPRLLGPFLWLRTHMVYLGFPGSSAGKESSCNAGDPDVIPGWGSSPGEGIGCQLQISWASLVAQMVKNRPAVWEMWAQSLGWEDPLEEGMATHSSILAWRIPMDRGAWWAAVHGVTKSQPRLSTSTAWCVYLHREHIWELSSCSEDVSGRGLDFLCVLKPGTLSRSSHMLLDAEELREYLWD